MRTKILYIIAFLELEIPPQPLLAFESRNLIHRSCQFLVLSTRANYTQNNTRRPSKTARKVSEAFGLHLEEGKGTMMYFVAPVG